ncbi:MAG: hypothetical protein ABIJ17_03745 [Patescibacteria group bacterium]
MVASAGISTGSMIACCAHHLIDILPILGLSAMFLFLAEYQVFFILLGIVSNIIGIIFMLEIIKKHSLHKDSVILSKIIKFDIKEIKNWAIVCGALMLLVSFLLIRGGNIKDVVKTPTSSLEKSEIITKTSSLPVKSNSAGGLSIDVEPINFSFDKLIQFKVSFNTHKGNLDFDLVKKSVIIDGNGNKYLPIEW